MDTSTMMMVAWPLHMLGMALVLGGGLLFLLWASRLKQEELKKIVKVLLVIGIAACLLACLMSGGKMMRYGKWDKYMMKDGKGMMMMDGRMMMDDDDMMDYVK